MTYRVWQSVVMRTFSLNCCSPSVTNPRLHTVLLKGPAIKLETDLQIYFLVSGAILCYTTVLQQLNHTDHYCF